MKSIRKVIGLVMVLLIIVVLVLFAYTLQKNKKYPFAYYETSLYLPLAGGELLELTEDGGVFRYSNKGEKTLLMESSNLRYLSVLYENGGVSVLSVHRDGTLGLSKDFSFDEKDIGSLEGAVKAELQENGIVVLTEAGEVYEGKIAETWSECYEAASKKVELKKIDLPEIIDISTAWDNNVCLTKTGEVWAKGEFFMNEYEEYTKIAMEMPAVQISNAGNTISALGEDGTLFEVGMALDENNVYTNNEQFEKVMTYGKAIQVCSSGERTVLFNEDETVHFFGHMDKGKASGVAWSGTVGSLKNIRQILIYGEYIYVLSEDSLYIRKEPLSKAW
ncbi:MAG: hypothetical protein IJW37_06290 [Lachnospiraceae bacterium]|nr:hypothetical protein [Lachnospiraceae bacterium]